MAALALAEFSDKLKTDVGLQLQVMALDNHRYRFPSPPRRAPAACQFVGIPSPPYGSRVDYFYILESERGVKFGISTNPSQRIYAHCQSASHFGVEPSRCWVSGPVGSSAREVESEFKRHNRGREFAPWSFHFATTKAEILLGPGEVFVPST